MTEYYECHVTIEPVFGSKLEVLNNICKYYKFKVANLLMQKRQEDTPERSKFDTFCTGHSGNYVDISDRMQLLILHLRVCNFKIWRYKIELIMVDSRQGDKLGLLN